MGQPLSPEVIARIREMKGHANAVEVSALVNCSPETVRRLWRGETHRPAMPSMDPASWLRRAYPEARPATPPESLEPADESDSLLRALQQLRPDLQ